MGFQKRDLLGELYRVGRDTKSHLVQLPAVEEQAGALFPEQPPLFLADFVPPRPKYLISHSSCPISPLFPWLVTAKLYTTTSSFLLIRMHPVYYSQILISLFLYLPVPVVSPTSPSEHESLCVREGGERERECCVPTCLVSVCAVCVVSICECALCIHHMHKYIATSTTGIWTFECWLSV